MVFSHAWLRQKRFGQSIRNGHAFWGRADTAAFKTDQIVPPAGCQNVVFSPKQIQAVCFRQVRHQNPPRSAQSEKERFQAHLFIGQFLPAFDRFRFSPDRGQVFLDRRQVPPAPPPVKGMSRGPEAEIRRMVPVFAVMAGFHAGKGEV